MSFEKIDRVVIAVPKIEEARELFSSMLGIEFEEVPVPDTLKLRAAYSSFGLELVEATAPNTLIDNFIRKRGEGVFAVVIKVTNMDDAVKIFEKKGMQRAGEVQYGALREVAFHPKKSHGVQIVLAEYPAKHPAITAILQKVK